MQEVGEESRCKERLVQSASVPTFDLAMAPSSDPAPKLQASCRDLTKCPTLTVYEGSEASWISVTTPDFVTSSAQILGPLGPVHRKQHSTLRMLCQGSK